MQHPLLAPLEGGRTIDFDAQEREAWGRLAEACAEALTLLHPQHPERCQFQVMLAECQRAAGLPLERARLSTA